MAALPVCSGNADSRAMASVVQMVSLIRLMSQAAVQLSCLESMPSLHTPQDMAHHVQQPAVTEWHQKLSRCWHCRAGYQHIIQKHCRAGSHPVAGDRGSRCLHCRRAHQHKGNTQGAHMLLDAHIFAHCTMRIEGNACNDKPLTAHRSRPPHEAHFTPSLPAAHSPSRVSFHSQANPAQTTWLAAGPSLEGVLQHSDQSREEPPRNTCQTIEIP